MSKTIDLVRLRSYEDSSDLEILIRILEKLTGIVRK